MPYPTYHVGVNAFFGLAFRRWVDPFVIVAVNVIIDLEVLFASGYPQYHRHWYFHTFVAGGIIGAVFGLLCWFFRNKISWSMKLLRIPYKPCLWKMSLAGTLGVCIHVLLDSFWHPDVQPFRPFTHTNPLYRMFKRSWQNDPVRHWIVIICTTLSIAAFILYILTVIRTNRRQKR